MRDVIAMVVAGVVLGMLFQTVPVPALVVAAIAISVAVISIDFRAWSR